MIKIKPLWIILDGGDLFEGHQGHWADTFYSNATAMNIMHTLVHEQKFFGDDGVSWVVREMTEEELAKYPGAMAFCEWLIKEYGEY